MSSSSSSVALAPKVCGAVEFSLAQMPGLNESQKNNLKACVVALSQVEFYGTVTAAQVFEQSKYDQAIADIALCPDNIFSQLLKSQVPNETSHSAIAQAVLGQMISQNRLNVQHPMECIPAKMKAMAQMTVSVVSQASDVELAGMGKLGQGYLENLRHNKAIEARLDGLANLDLNNDK